MKPSFFASTLGVLFLFSIISYSRTFIRAQEPPQNPAQVTKQVPTGPSTVTSQTSSEPANLESKLLPPPSSLAEGTSAPATTAEKAPSAEVKDKDALPVIEVAPHSYTATAYCLRGRTASGRYVSRGLIAADPRVLPLGTRVRIEAGSLSGEYLVADTGGKIKGKRIDIWIPTRREAFQFGRRSIKLRVLSWGKPSKRSVRKANNSIQSNTNR